MANSIIIGTWTIRSSAAGLNPSPSGHVKARTFPAQSFSQRPRENFGARTGASRLCGFAP